MKASELKDLSREELQSKLNELKQEHFNLRFQHATAQLENTATIGKLKKDIARVMTVMNERKSN